MNADFMYVCIYIVLYMYICIIIVVSTFLQRPNAAKPLDYSQALGQNSYDQDQFHGQDLKFRQVSKSAAADGVQPCLVSGSA